MERGGGEGGGGVNMIRSTFKIFFFTRFYLFHNRLKKEKNITRILKTATFLCKTITTFIQLIKE